MLPGLLISEDKWASREPDLSFVDDPRHQDVFDRGQDEMLEQGRQDPKR